MLLQHVNMPDSHKNILKDRCQISVWYETYFTRVPSKDYWIRRDREIVSIKRETYRLVHLVLTQLYTTSTVHWEWLWISYTTTHYTMTPQGQHCSKIMKPPQSLSLQMAERLLWTQPDSAANHVTARSISDWRAFTWLVTETGWARRKRSDICGGKLISVHMIPHDVNRRYGI